MRISFDVKGVPPKKDGADSMWGKRSEIPRNKALRRGAKEALARARATSPPRAKSVLLAVRVHAATSAGDVDNFITGICDTLMPAHARTGVDDAAWRDVDEEIRPKRAIAYEDDAIVTRILAERVPTDGEAFYEVVIDFDQ